LLRKKGIEQLEMEVAHLSIDPCSVLVAAMSRHGGSNEVKNTLAADGRRWTQMKNDVQTKDNHLSPQNGTKRARAAE
jgi:hypothetical protein